jgi:excisionase family DNA binding protein
MQKDLYTVRDIAEQLQVQEKAVRGLIASGELKASKVLNKWIVTAESLKAFIDAKASKGDEHNRIY